MNNENDSSNVRYPSTKLILETCTSEYHKETQRTSSIDTKTSIFLTVSTALYAFFIPLSNLKDLYNQEISITASVIATLVTILVIAAFLSLIVSTVIFISVISSRQYKAIDISALLKYADKKEENTSVVLCRLYDSAISFNRELNEKRMRLFKCGVISILCCILLTTITYFIKVNFI